MKKKVQAQRKFAQGAFVPHVHTNNNLERRVEAPNRDDQRNTITLHNMSANMLLDLVSFTNMHVHNKNLQPVVRLERLKKFHDPPATIARHRDTENIEPRRSSRTPKKKIMFNPAYPAMKLKPRRSPRKRILDLQENDEDNTPLKFFAKAKVDKNKDNSSPAVKRPKRETTTTNTKTQSPTKSSPLKLALREAKTIVYKKLRTRRALEIKKTLKASSTTTKLKVYATRNRTKPLGRMKPNGRVPGKIKSSLRKKSTNPTSNIIERGIEPESSRSLSNEARKEILKEPNTPKRKNSTNQEPATTESSADVSQSSFYDPNGIERWINRAISNEQEEENEVFKMPAPPKLVGRSIVDVDNFKDEIASQTCVSPTPSLCPSERYCTVREVVAALDNDLESRCMSCASCTRVNKVETLSRLVQQPLTPSETAGNNDIYEFDPKDEFSIEDPRNFQMNRDGRESPSLQSLCGAEASYFCLDLLPEKSTHIIQIMSAIIPRRNNELILRARLMAKSSTGNHKELGLIEHENLLDQLLATLNMSIKKENPPSGQPNISSPSESRSVPSANPVTASPYASTPQIPIVSLVLPVVTSASSTPLASTTSTATLTKNTIREMNSNSQPSTSKVTTRGTKVTNRAGKSTQETSNRPGKSNQETGNRPGKSDQETSSRPRKSSQEFGNRSGKSNQEVSNSHGKTTQETGNRHGKTSQESNRQTKSCMDKEPIKKERDREPTAGTSNKSNVNTPDQSRSGILMDAPIFYPTEEEFTDPLAYFTKIMPEASNHGLCKVVAPKGFDPSCTLKNEIRFNVSNQYIARLYNRWGPASMEMCAIKTYLASQRVLFNRAPLLDSLEVNLPKLYHVVQRHGGLKKVIEKKRWGRVAEELRISKTCNPKKLDLLYLRYLLPYDTLSHNERQQMMGSVEKGWKTKNRKMLERASNPLHRQKRLLGESESSGEDTEEDSDMAAALAEAEDCVVPGRNMTLATFTKAASAAKESYYGQASHPRPADVEEEYWRIVLLGADHVCVYTASIDTGDEGYGFPTDPTDEYGTHPWNLKMISQNDSNVLRSLGPVVGVTVPTLHLGMMFSTSCWHRDPHGLPWMEYMHCGPRKIWYGIPDERSNNFRKAVEALCPTSCQNKSIWLPSDITMIPPHLLREHNVTLSRVEQSPGEYVIVFPKAYSCSISTGYTVSESVCFATESWLNGVDQVFQELRDSCEPTMFSLEQLLLAIASDSRSSPRILKLISDSLGRIVADEFSRRLALTRIGITATADNASNSRQWRKRPVGAWNIREQDECEVCRATLYLSKVTGVTGKKSAVCLQHALQLLASTQRSGESRANLVTFSSKEELRDAIGGLRARLNKVYTTID